MKLTSLGHSSFLLEMQSSAGETVRILGDPWLSDYVIGDLMGRAPRLRLDYGKLPRLHGIYLSHSHTDHFDPYTLLDLWRNLREKPTILLPQSIEYLQPLLEEFLAGVQCTVLVENQPAKLNGLKVSGLFNLELRASNEDDVMMLVVENGRELFLAEADAAFPYGDPESRDMISALLADRRLRAVAFLAIKNELRALMASVNARNLKERARAVTECRELTRQEIEESYRELDGIEHDLWRDRRLVRFIGGQGICFPQRLDPRWNRVLFPLPLGERARMEREIAGERGYPHRVQEFLPGHSYEIGAGEVAEDGPAGFFTLLDPPEDFAFDGKLACFQEFPAGPLRDEDRDREAQQTRILDCLNTRFLPWLIGRRDPPIESLLTEQGGEYRIRVRYGRRQAPTELDYCISFARLHFASEPGRGDAQEIYWANDLEDYLAGRCDDFSRFCRQPEAASQRLWECLGMPYLNNDLVEQKLRFHFENARAGKPLEDWVLGFYPPPQS